jgi:hypothetical protein
MTRDPQGEAGREINKAHQDLAKDACNRADALVQELQRRGWALPV